MRLIIRIIAVCLFISSLVLIIVSSGIGSHYCATSLTFQYENHFEDYVSFYDFNSGIALPGQKIVADSETLSPDAVYRYEIPTDRESDVILIDSRTGDRQLIYRSPHIRRVTWSLDSRILLIWEYDGRSPLMMTRIDTETHEALTRYGFAPGFGGLNNTSPDNRYIYAQFPINLVTGTIGLAFVDTVTGDITRFRQATTFPYAWSDDSRWIASEFEGLLSIIDPQTGDYHPEFPEGIAGEGFIWYENSLWFSRIESEEEATIWRANLSDGSIELMVENARLETLSGNGHYASILDGQSGDLAIYNFAIESRYALNYQDTVETDQRVVRYSPNGRCMAILLSEIANPDNQVLRIVDLQSNHNIQQGVLNNSFEFYDMNWIEDD